MSPSRSASPATTCRSAWTPCCTCRCSIRIWPPTASPTTALPSRSSRRRPCAARSARSSSIAPSKRAAIINANVVAELDKASGAWGVKVMRYEIKNITPPKDVLSAMEKQMRAEREKRAVVLTSEGERDAKINQAEGDKQRVIKASEANKQQQINEADGQAAAILAVATATAEGLRQGRRRAQRARRHRGHAAAHRRGVRAPVRQAGEGEHDAGRTGPSDRSGLRRHHGHQHHPQADRRHAAGAGRLDPLARPAPTTNPGLKASP